MIVEVVWPLTVPATTSKLTVQPGDEKLAGTISVLFAAVRESS